MFSNRYIFVFSTIMVTAVALILSLTSTILQPFQQHNLNLDKMKDILVSAQIFVEKDLITESYDQYVTTEIVLDLEGNEIAVFENGSFTKGDLRAFDINLREQLYQINRNGAGFLPLYVIDKENLLYYVIPLYGSGLWGPIWGTIAIADDLNTVVGVTFGHQGETPGLGAEIDTREFQKQFEGKFIFDENGEFKSIRVVKGGVRNNASVPEAHGVDGITGGTITSDGTTDMLYNGLKNYLPYFKKLKMQN